MDRRQFQIGVASLLTGAMAPALQGCASPHRLPLAQADEQEAARPWLPIERRAGGRLGVAVLDIASGQVQGHRLDERFPMCSTFKWLAAAAVLARVDAGQERLDRRMAYGPEVLVPYSPVSGLHATGVGDGQGMSLAELCEAAITVSDNAAANLILQTLGGPEGLTRFAQTRLADNRTRLDRWEPELNEARPGDPRDTTTPRAMAAALSKAVVGETLSHASRARLAAWLQATRTNEKRLRADLPPGWRMGSKTGTGQRGTTNDVGVFWPPGRLPIVVAVYLTDTLAPEAERNGAVADVAKWVAGTLKS